MGFFGMPELWPSVCSLTSASPFCRKYRLIQDVIVDRPSETRFNNLYNRFKSANSDYGESRTESKWLLGVKLITIKKAKLAISSSWADKNNLFSHSWGWVNFLIKESYNFNTDNREHIARTFNAIVVEHVNNAAVLHFDYRMHMFSNEFFVDDL